MHAKSVSVGVLIVAGTNVKAQLKNNDPLTLCICMRSLCPSENCSHPRVAVSLSLSSATPWWPLHLGRHHLHLSRFTSPWEVCALVMLNKCRAQPSIPCEGCTMPTDHYLMPLNAPLVKRNMNAEHSRTGKSAVH